MGKPKLICAQCNRALSPDTKWFQTNHTMHYTCYKKKLEEFTLQVTLENYLRERER